MEQNEQDRLLLIVVRRRFVSGGNDVREDSVVWEAVWSVEARGGPRAPSRPCCQEPRGGNTVARFAALVEGTAYRAWPRPASADRTGAVPRGWVATQTGNRGSARRRCLPGRGLKSNPNTWPLLNGRMAGNARSEPPQLNSAVARESQKTDATERYRHNGNHVEGCVLHPSAEEVRHIPRTKDKTVQVVTISAAKRVAAT